MKIGEKHKIFFFSLLLNEVDIFWEGQFKQELPILFDAIDRKF